jgi:LuxR family transcriptional regulator of csgAB operon
VKNSSDGNVDNRTASGREYVLICSPDNLQNKLLCHFLEERTEFTCTCIPELTLQDIKDIDQRCKYLFMVDSRQDDLSTLWQALLISYKSNLQNCHFALYNVDQGMDIDKAALARGVHGIFYNEDGLASLAKGASAILDGELWFRRKLMSESLLDNERVISSYIASSSDLTSREKEILTQLITGASNKQIADRLFISPHTVKTHIYNVYKKLGINNRLQATLWAAKHL